MSATDELRRFLDEHLPTFREQWGEEPGFPLCQPLLRHLLR